MYSKNGATNNEEYPPSIWRIPIANEKGKNKNDDENEGEVREEKMA